MRWLAIMAATGVVLAFAAWAGSVTADCSQPVSKLSLAQIEHCKELQEAFRDLAKIGEGSLKDSGVLVIRGSGTGRQ